LVDGVADEWEVPVGDHVLSGSVLCEGGHEDSPKVAEWQSTPGEGGKDAFPFGFQGRDF
jgi:hypothetical protein